jgi:replicative DNA helicase
MRLLAATAKIDLGRIINGSLNARDWDMLNSAISKLSKTKIFIDDSAGTTVNEIRAKCRRLKNSEAGLGLVIIDYLQLVTSSTKHNGNRQQEVSEISRMLKTMAIELDIPVIALSQLSRGVESREDKRPIMSDLRESGAIEQDADVVSFLYRDDYYNRDSEEGQEENPASVVEIIIGKHRSGPTGTVKVAFLRNFQLFRNYVERD